MDQPKKSKSKLLYDAVSKDYNVGTYDEFNSKMADPAKRRAFYDGVGAEYNLGEYAEFEAKIAPEKKKVASDSTVQGTVWESPSAKTSSVTAKSNQIPGRELLVKDSFSTKIPVSTKPQVSVGQSAYNEFKKAEAVSDEKKAEIAIGVEKDANNQGIWNKIKTGAKSWWNNVFDDASLQVSTDALQSEKDEAKKILQEQNIQLKAQKKPISTITQEAITQKAKEIAIDKRVKSQSDSQVRSLLKSYDSWDPEKKEALVKFSELEKKSFSDKDKTLLGKQEILRYEIDDTIGSLNSLNATVKELNKSKQPISEDLIQQYNATAEKYQSLVSDALKNQQEYISNTEKLGKAEDNLDLFKRDYGWTENFVRNVGGASADIVSGLFGFGDYALNTKESLTPESLKPMVKAIDAPLRGFFKDSAERAKGGAEKERSQIMRPIAVEDINNFSDFGSWFSNTISSQAPILGLAMTGTGGIATLGASATGQKFEEMQSENESGQSNYSDAQMVGIPLVFGATESVSATVDKLVLGNVSRVIRSATAPERKLIAEGFWNGVKETSKSSLKGGVMEGIEESGTQIAQNFIDIYAGDKKDVNLFDGVKDAGSAGLALGVFLPMSAGLVAGAVKTFTPKSDTKIQEASAEVLSLQKQLENIELTQESRKIIENQLDQSESKVQSLLKTKIKDISSMPDEQFQEVIELERKQTEIKEQAQEIQNQEGMDDASKKQVLANLKAEYNSTETRRDDLLERGGNTALLKLDEEEKIKVLDKASRQLMKEQNPDGTKSIKLTEAEINKRAGQIVNEDIKKQKSKDEAKLAEQQKEQKPETQPKAQEQAEVVEAINKTDESTQTEDTPADGGISTRVASVEESGNTVQPNIETESVSTTVDARTSKDNVEITNKIENESNTRPETESVQENTGLAKEKSTRKPRTAKTEKNLTKPSMRGKTPLDKRKIKDKTMISALDADTITPYDAVQQFFIGGGRVLTDDIKALLGTGEEARLRQQYARTKANGGETIDAISDKLWQEYGSESGIDQMEFKNAIEDVIKTSLSLKSMAESFLDRNGIDQKEDVELIETPYGPMTQEQIDDFIAYEEMRQSKEAESEPQHQEAISFLETLTDEEMVRLAEEENLAFEDFLNEIEEKETERDYSDAREVQSMGVSMRREGRDFSLSKGGTVKELNPFRRKFKRLWNRTFKSNAGLKNSTGEVIRSLDRDIANYTDGFNAETTEFKSIINKVKKKAKDAEDYRKKMLLINDYMAGADVKLSFLNPDEKAKLDYMRGRIDNLSDSIIDRLKKNIEALESKKQTAYTKEAIENTKLLIEKIKANKEKYINRTYQIFTDESYRESITQPYESLNAEGRRRIDNVVDYLMKDQGFSEEQARSYVSGYLDDIKRAKVDVNMASKGKSEADFLKKRKDLPIEFQELLGVSRDPIYNYVHTVFKLANYLASVSYQERLRENLLNENIAVTEPRQGYTKLTSDSETWKVLSDLYVPNEVKESMDDMMPLERIDNDFLRYWVKAASFTKVGKTILNPTGTFRNFLSGNFLGLNAGHFMWANPKNAYEAMHQAWGTSKSRTELGEFREELIAEGIVGEGGASGEMLAYMNDFSKPVDRLVSKNPLMKAFDFMQKAYAFGDDFFKVGGYVIEKNRLMREGLSESEARKISGERNRGGYPTYSYLPKTFQQLRRIPIIGTFVSFPYEVIRSTKNNALYAYEDFKAGRNKMASQRVAGMVIANALPTLLSVYSMSLIGFDDEDEDALRNMLPEYQKDSLLYYTGKDEDGKPTFIDLTVYFPSEVAVKPLRIVMEERAGRNSVEKVGIAIDEVTEPYIGIDLSTKTIKELLENENEYNKKIYEGKNLMEGVFKDPNPIINHYLKKAGPGVYSNLTEFARANEINPEFFGEKNTSYGKEYTNQDALWGFFGFRFSTVNYDNALSNYGKETKEYLKENRSKVGKGFNSTVPLSDEKVKELVTKYVDKNDEVYSNFINSINSAEKLGMDNGRIAKSLKASGFKKEDIIYLLNDVPPATPLITKDAFVDQLDRIDVNNKKDKAVELKKTYLENAKKFNREIERQNKERLRLFLKEKKEKASE